jgi:hypothetical protein
LHREVQREDERLVAASIPGKHLPAAPTLTEQKRGRIVSGDIPSKVLQPARARQRTRDGYRADVRSDAQEAGASLPAPDEARAMR